MTDKQRTDPSLPSLHDPLLTETLSDYDLQRLLDRIQVHHVHEPNFDCLERLRDAFSKSFAYENIDVLLGREIRLNRDALVTKLLDQGRGGYCFELNTLFGIMLKTLGYDVAMHLGRVWLRNPQGVPERNHGTIIVVIENISYLADVGFGGRSPRIVMRILDDDAVLDGDAANEPVRIIEFQDDLMVQRKIEGCWHNQFSFERKPASVNDVAVANFFQYAYPDSQFKHHLFVGKFTENGRDGLFDTRVSRRVGSKVDTAQLTTFPEIFEVLRDVFRLDVGAVEAQLAECLQGLKD